MRLTLRDFTVTAMLAALLAVYSSYIALEGLPLLWGVPEMATTGLIVGAASWCLIAREQFLRHPIALTICGIAVVVGLLAIATQSETLLTILMASIGMLWVRGLYLRSAAPRTVARLRAPLTHSGVH